MLVAANIHLETKNLCIATSTIVAATKNARDERDPEMRSPKKGNQRHFGLKAHIGVAARVGHEPSLATSAAHGSDVHMLPDLSGSTLNYGQSTLTK